MLYPLFRRRDGVNQRNAKKGKGKSHHQRMAEARVAEKDNNEGGGSEDAPGES